MRGAVCPPPQRWTGCTNRSHVRAATLPSGPLSWRTQTPVSQRSPPLPSFFCFTVPESPLHTPRCARLRLTSQMYTTRATMPTLEASQQHAVRTVPAPSLKCIGCISFAFACTLMERLSHSRSLSVRRFLASAAASTPQWLPASPSRRTPKRSPGSKPY
jgi:hypothetical protein